MWASSFDVETLSWVIPVQVREVEGSFWAKVDMGNPSSIGPSIPAVGSGELILAEIEDYRVSAVNTGVPHAGVLRG